MAIFQMEMGQIPPRKHRRHRRSVEEWKTLCHKALLATSHCVAELRGTSLSHAYWCLNGCDCAYWQGVKGEMLRLINELCACPFERLQPPLYLLGQLWRAHYDFVGNYPVASPFAAMPSFGYDV